MVFFPIAEVFGYAPDDTSPEATAARAGRLCAPRGGGQLCTKPAQDGKGGVMGACSLTVRDAQDETAPATTEIICPHRFLEADVVFSELKQFLVPGQTEVVAVPEVRVHSSPVENSYQLGNVDWTLCAVDAPALAGPSEPQIVAYGTAEFQSVYTSGGGLQQIYNDYMTLPEPKQPQNVSVPTLPRADFQSSGRKRLAPQLRAKGAEFAAAGVKQAVVLTKGLYDKEFRRFLRPEPTQEGTDLLWLLVEVDPGKSPGLKVVERVYTKYTTAMEQLATIPAADLERFEATLLKKALLRAATTPEESATSAP